jgi:predicted ATPase/class 3 adenylate cyclase
VAIGAADLTSAVIAAGSAARKQCERAASCCEVARPYADEHRRCFGSTAQHDARLSSCSCVSLFTSVGARARGVAFGPMARPAGIVTFLFTDIEGSTRRWETDPDAMRRELAVHDDVLRTVIEAQGGWQFKHTGDGVCAAFASPRAAVDAAIVAQRSLALPVRMGIATGDAEQRGDDYFGPACNRAARVMAAGHGGQILVAATTAALVHDLEFIDLGARRLRDLSEPLPIFQVCAEGLCAEFPPLRTMDTVPGNLPAAATSFLGREVQIGAIADALHEHRLVTLVGVGGVGKTRLALHTAAAVLDEYRDGAWLVELAPILDAADLTEAVAAVFAIAPAAGRTWLDGLIDSLRARQVLLVLDNCEHVLDATASLVERLLARVPDVTVLATSRESLGIDGEWAWPVPSLDVGPNSTSSALFVERARAVEPGFESGNEVDAVAEICRRLDGIPLAVELAAARVRSMSPTQIRDRLDERFRLLTGSRRSLERHQTLHHAVQWSYDLLTATEQRVLQRASVFAGSFSLAAATMVCGFDIDGDLDEFQMLDVVDSLVRKSLVDVERTSVEVRYSMLETIRQFAEERLGESTDADAVRDRHASFFAEQAEAAFDMWLSPHEALAYRFVDDEIANLRAAFRWAADNGRADPAILIAACAHELARMRLRTETFGWPGEVVDLARQLEHRKLPQLLSMASDSAWAMGHLDEAKRYARESIALIDDPRFEPFTVAYIDLAEIAMFEGDVDAGLELLRTGAAHPADHADRILLACFLGFGGLVGEYLPDDELAEALAQIKMAGVPLGIAFALSGQAASLAERDIAAAIELYQEAINIFESCGNRLIQQRVRARLAGLLATSADPERALASFVEIVDAWRINGDTMLSEGIAQLAVLLARLGHHDGAARLYGAVTRGFSLDALVPELDATMTTAREVMGDTAFRAACDAGAALSYEAAGELACDLITHARAELARDR